MSSGYVQLLQQDVPLSWYLLLSAVLFSLGIVGFLIKRNLITVFMSIELMLNAVNLSFVTFAHQWHAVKGQIFVFFVMMVAAAEAAVGLAIIIAVFRARATLAVDRIDLAVAFEQATHFIFCSGEWQIANINRRHSTSLTDSAREVRAGPARTRFQHADRRADSAATKAWTFGCALLHLGRTLTQKPAN